MLKVMFFGSRHLKELPTETQINLAICMGRGDIILVGDCPGHDQLVLQHLARCGYINTTVYYSGDKPRIDTGSALKRRRIPVNSTDIPDSVEYHRRKDEAMVMDCQMAVGTIFSEAHECKASKYVIGLLDDVHKPCNTVFV